LSGPRREWFYKLLELVRPRVKKLDQFVEELRPFLQDAVDYDQAAIAKHLAKPEVRDVLAALPGTLSSLAPFTSATVEPALRALAESQGIKAAALIHATRVAVTGRAVSPGLFDVLELLGSERASSRVWDVIRYLSK
jgi:glutamyl-tRNA synthetase